MEGEYTAGTEDGTSIHTTKTAGRTVHVSLTTLFQITHGFLLYYYCAGSSRYWQNTGNLK